ncbi:MAG TPA: hypothetical protein VG496_03990 [Myxococcales bacterium]|nr:hypothetical protein [Myxococcales bacterium]
MGKALLLLLIGAIVAVFFVPLHGKTLWDRAQHRGLPNSVAVAARGVVSFFSGPQKKRAVASAAPAAAGRRAPEPAGERILKAPPKERLSPDDRASLDRLVDTHRR